jgi:serine/threonine-protein kinase
MMLTPAGVVKLMDFGIARMTADRKLTQTGRTVGSLYYMSPEQIQGAVDLDGRSDLYSVGVSLYELCTNRRPFQGDSDYSIMAAHLNATPVPPIELDRSLPAALNDIILMSIAKDPAQRFQTAEAFRVALNSVTAGSGAAPTVAMPGSATRIGGPGAAAAAAPFQNPPPLMSEALKPPPTLADNTAGGAGSRRGLYMAVGSVVTVAVLAIVALQAPKFFDSSSAATAASEPAPPAGPQATPAATPPQQSSPEPSASVLPQSDPNPEAGAAAPTASVRPIPNEPKSLPNRIALSPPTSAPASQTPVAAQQVPVQQVPQTQTAPLQPQAPATQAPPGSAPSVNMQELEDLRERMMLLATRANSVRGSLNSMRRQMGGLNLNAEITTREQRMEAFMDQAEGALKANDAGRSKKSLDSAERVIEELEKRLGR